METFEEKLDELRKKQPSELSENDLAFLQARRSYLQPEEVAKFGLGEASEPEEVKPAKKAKKASEPEDTPVA